MSITIPTLIGDVAGIIPPSKGNGPECREVSIPPEFMPLGIPEACLRRIVILRYVVLQHCQM
jgi:hypothetical protein